MNDATASSPNRVISFDGFRGLACGLVVLSHLWAIVPADDLARTGMFHGMFLAGNLAVSVFLVLGSYLVVSGFLLGPRRIGRFWGRRLARLAPQLSALLAVLYAISWFDTWDEWTRSATARSVAGVATFTFNWTLIAHAPDSRADLGHLWYLSVEQQVYVVLLPILALAALAFGTRFRMVLTPLLIVAAVGAMIWRFHLLETKGWWTSSLSTFSRMDGLLLGAAAALATPALRRYRAAARHVTMPALTVLAILVVMLPELNSFSYLEYPGIVGVVAAVVLIVSIAVADNPTGRCERWLSTWPLRRLGAVSYPLYLWHLPIFYMSARWMSGWAWPPRAIAALVVLVAVVAVADVAIERPVAAWLARRNAARAAEPTRHLVDEPV